jgi:hypothetical protein
MTERRAWLRQAESDYEASARLYDPADPSTYCHSIAKCQQAMEKVVKSLIACLRDAEIVSIHVGYQHDVARYISTLLFLPRVQANRTIQRRIHRILDTGTRQKIETLDELAPRRPAPGALHARNTEYPFQQAPGAVWRIPAERDVFSRKECEDYRSLASVLVREFGMLLFAIEQTLR